MVSFGGFSGNADIENYLASIQAEFVSMVTSHSLLLARYLREQQEVIRVAQRQAYPRIGLILSAAKNLNNSFLFAEPNNPSDLPVLYQNVVDLMTSVGSPFSEGITNVAAGLTAATLIRQLPLNSDIRNIDSAEAIEKAAVSDLDRIIFLYKESKPAEISIVSISPSASTIHIALDIDKTTLPASAFNVDPLDEVVNLTSNVRTLERLTIPDKAAFGWYYISSIESEYQDEDGRWKYDAKDAIKGTFPVFDGDTADDIVERLADTLNSVSLAATFNSNILVSPNRGDLALRATTVPKKRIYDNIPNDPYDRKVASFRLLQRINYLSFSARRSSPAVSRDLIILRFYSVPKHELIPEGVQYAGLWDNATLYNAGDVVDYQNKSYCAILDAAPGVTPTSSVYDPESPGSGVWKELDTDSFRDIYVFVDDSNLTPPHPADLYIEKADPFIEGLVYGLTPSYTFLDKKGPKSLVLDVNKGTVRSLSVPNDGGTDAPEDPDFVADTFYFGYSINADLDLKITGDLKIRVSSTDFAAFDDEIEPIFPADGILTIPLTSVAPDEVAVEVTKKLYSVSQYTNILGALVHPHAVQIASFQRTPKELKEVVDILPPIPAGLDIATGTAIKERTPYAPKARSVIVKAEIENVKTTTPPAGKTPEEELPNNKDYGVASVSRVRRSSALQNVYDKLDYLNSQDKTYKRKIGGDVLY